MRFGNLDSRLALIVGGEAVDIRDGSDGQLPSEPLSALEIWDDVVAWAESYDGPTSPLDLSKLGAPVPNPRQVFALGLNYVDHAREGGVPIPDHPVVFTKFPACIAPAGRSVVLPSANVDWEIELVAIIGRRAHHVSEADAWNVIAGLTVGQDLSERVIQNRKPAPQFSLGKSFPGFGPIGPLMVTPDEFADRDDLELVCTLNGEEVQHGRTRDLIFSVPAVIATISAIVPMLPGDLIFTGTPAGVGMARQPPRFLRAGDELNSTIEGIGTIYSRFVDPSSEPTPQLQISQAAR